MENKFVPMSKERVYELIEAAQNGDEAAMEALVLDNAGLVKKAASRFQSVSCGVSNEPEDLIQIGYMGLIKAIEKFDTSYDVMFSTYAVPMIIGEIKRFLRDDGRIKAGRSLKSEVYALRKAQADFVQSHGVSPHVSQLAEILGVPKEHILEIMEADNALGNITSLDTLLVDEEQSEYLKENSPETSLDALMLKQGVKHLPSDMRKVISLRYYRDITQNEIAKLLGVSQVQVSRLEKRAIKMMQEELCEE